MRSNLPISFRDIDFPDMRTWRPLFQDLDELFNSFSVPSETGKWNAFGPAEVEEVEDHYVLSFDMPGIGKENIDVEVTGQQLRVHGESNTQGKQRRVFDRTVLLPERINTESIDAQYENGVLRIAIPKAEEAKTKKIQVGESKEGFFKRLTTSSTEKKEGQGEKVKVA